MLRNFGEESPQKGIISLFVLLVLILLIASGGAFLFKYRHNLSNVLGEQASSEPEYVSNVILVKLKDEPSRTLSTRVFQAPDSRLDVSQSSSAVGVSGLDSLIKQGGLKQIEAVFNNPGGASARTNSVNDGNLSAEATRSKSSLSRWYKIVLNKDAKNVKKDSTEYKELISKVEEIKKKGEVEEVSLDGVVKALYKPNDPLYELPGQLDFESQYALRKIQANLAWDKTKGSPNVIVAVLDSGVYSHADLTGRIVNSVDFTYSPNGPADIFGHGTQVAGIIAANMDNSIGVAGIAPQVSLMNVKVLNDGGNGDLATMTKGIVWAADAGAGVINMSLGGGFDCNHPDWKLLKDTVDYAYSAKNVVIVAAAGNESRSGANLPANCNNVVSVAATDTYDTKVTFSNYGTDVDIAAPGILVMTTKKDNQYGHFAGTSAATPHVAAVAALVKSLNPSFTAGQVIDRVLKNADAIAGTGSYWSNGRVNAYRAVNIPTGSITATPCQIPVGASVCTSTVTWQTPVGTSNVKVMVRENPGSVFAGTPSGSQNAPWVTALGATFDLYAGESFIASARVVGSAPGSISGTISASPNPCSLSGGATCSSIITWNTPAGTPDVKVRLREVPGSLFAAGPSGSQNAPWIGAGGMTFDLYSGNNLISSVKVGGSTGGTISAAPNPCSLNGNTTCSSTISWSTFPGTPDVKVRLREVPGSLFAAGPSGSQNAPWIGSGGYNFDLYSGSTLLNTVFVKGN